MRKSCVCILQRVLHEDTHGQRAQSGEEGGELSGGKRGGGGGAGGRGHGKAFHTT